MLLALALPVPAAAELDLMGTWHLLVHYQEPDSEEPERWHWHDRLWVFAAEGDRVRFTEYPVVVFDRRSGRYERGLNGQWLQSEGAWEPDARQLGEIEAGLTVNPRGSRSKTLRATGDGRLSSARAGGYDSARFVTFETRVEIDPRGALPEIVIRDSLDSSAAEGREGVTRYGAESVDASGARIEGRYERDGRQRGRFVMRRSGGARTDETEALPSERELTYERFYRQLGRSLRGAEALPESVPGLPDEAARTALRERVEVALEEGFRAQGNDPRPYAPQIRNLADAIVALYEEGRSRDEIGTLLQAGQLRP